jgi:hypothetical protein
VKKKKWSKDNEFVFDKGDWGLSFLTNAIVFETKKCFSISIVPHALEHKHPQTRHPDVLA